jgi:hypothetical protein
MAAATKAAGAGAGVAATLQGNGAIGLIPTGQVLDYYLTNMEDKALAKSIIKFMRNFSLKVKAVHKFIPHPHKDIILSALRTHYQLEFRVSYGPDVEKKVFTLGMGYIKRLTSPEFLPSTKTQIAIMKKKATKPSIY